MDEGFLAPRRTSPTTMGVVILAHVAVLTAVIVAKGPPLALPPEVIKTILIPETKDPDPLPPPPKPADPRPTPRAPSRIDVQKPIVSTDRNDAVEIAILPKLPTIPDAPVVGPIAPPPPVHVPVLADPVPDPRYAGSLQPPYPAAMMRAEVEGRAVVRVLVGTDGRVKSVEIVSADDPAFAEATRRQALTRWRFRPATRDGVAVEGWRTMTVHFRMDA